MKIEGAALRAALECASKPSKKRPEFWASRIRVAPIDKKTCAIEATDGIVLFRLVIAHPQSEDAYFTREILSRVRAEDRVEIDGRDVEVESKDGAVAMTATLLARAEPMLTDDKTGKDLRAWPDFEAHIPKGKRNAASMIGIGSGPMGKIARASKQLSTRDDPLVLRMEAGGAGEPVKLVGKSIYGEVVFVIKPVTIAAQDEPKKDEKAAA